MLVPAARGSRSSQSRVAVGEGGGDREANDTDKPSKPVLGLSQINAVRKDAVAASVAARFDVVSASLPPGCVPTLASLPGLEGLDAFAIDGEANLH